jgi:hypothetical protein
MGEQVLLVDPKTGKRTMAPPSADSRQNDGYKPQSNHHLHARDFSHPHSIPADEYEAATGRNHAEACAEYDKANNPEPEKEPAPADPPPPDDPAPPAA